MTLSIKLIPSFKHKCPPKMHYEVEEFKKNIFRILICYDNKFFYNDREYVKCCWGFYDYKKQQYYSLINSNKIGKVVDIELTTPYSSIRINKTPLEKAFN